MQDWIASLRRLPIVKLAVIVCSLEAVGGVWTRQRLLAAADDASTAAPASVDTYAQDVGEAIFHASLPGEVPLIYLRHPSHLTVTIRIGLINEQADIERQGSALRAWAWSLMTQTQVNASGEPLIASLEDEDLELDCAAGEIYSACTIDVIPRELDKAGAILSQLLLGRGARASAADLLRRRLMTTLHATPTSTSYELNSLLFSAEQGLFHPPARLAEALQELQHRDIETYRDGLRQPQPWFVVATGPVSLEVLHGGLAKSLTGSRWRMQRPVLIPDFQSGTRSAISVGTPGASVLTWAWPRSQSSLSESRSTAAPAQTNHLERFDVDEATMLTLLRLVREDLARRDAEDHARAWVALERHALGHIEGRARTHAPQAFLKILSDVQTAFGSTRLPSERVAEAARSAAEALLEQLDDPRATLDLLAQYWVRSQQPRTVAEVLTALARVTPEAVRVLAQRVMREPRMVARLGVENVLTPADVDPFVQQKQPGGEP